MNLPEFKEQLMANTEEPMLFVMTNARCVCGKARRIPVRTPSTEQAPLLHITEEPCECGRFSCRIGAKPMSMIDTVLD
jgi:hypothetical protein